MSDRFPGGVISKTPPTVVAPVDGEGGSASGVWTLDEVLGYEKATAWPKKVLPRGLYAWGYNNQGQVGDNTVLSRSSPVQIGALTNWSKIATGGNGRHTASIKTDGTLWAWGYNANTGQLGDGTKINRSSPVQIGALTNWYQISANQYNTGSIKTDGTLWVWGKNTDGNIGDNTIIFKSSPVQIGALTTWSQIACGVNHTAAIKADGTIWSWGRNNYGQLGLNISTSIRRSSPVQIGALTTWSQVTAGAFFTAAIKTDGTLWAWGRNNDGQIGDDTNVSKSSPVQIGALTNWYQISVAYRHAAAIKTDGTLWAWGFNSNGQLGIGVAAVSERRSSPVQIGALTTWSQVSAGYQHTASIKTDGTLWTWGRNNPRGQLGDGTVVDRSSPVQVGALTNWSQAAAAGQFTVALTKG